MMMHYPCPHKFASWVQCPWCTGRQTEFEPKKDFEWVKKQARRGLYQDSFVDKAIPIIVFGAIAISAVSFLLVTWHVYFR